jgi:secondary thiamine-phosphate synthase enzyme
VSEYEPYFTHTHEGSDDMPSHIRMVLTGCTQTIPIINGRLALGIWQGIFLFEHRDAPHTRSIAISILGSS